MNNSTEVSAKLHALIDTDRLVERTVELIQIRSVNPVDDEPTDATSEANVAAWMADHLDRLGFAISLDNVAPGRPNLTATRRFGAGPHLAFAGHTDTVGVAGYADPFSGHIADGRIHGRGACDMKGALVAFIEVAEVLAAGGLALPGSLSILGIADEEHRMIGSTALAASGIDADFAIVGEPTELAICRAHLGQFAFSVRTTGRAVHSSIAEQGINAIEAMTPVINMLADYRTELGAATPHELCGHGKVNVGLIRGGAEVSIVPDHCEIGVDRRIVPGETSSGVRAELQQRLDVLMAASPDLQVELGEAIIDARPLETAADAPVVAAAQVAMRNLGRPDTAGAFPASTDAPNLGVPAIVWGPGSLSRAHTIDEYLEIDELIAAAHAYLDATLNLIG